MPVRIAIEGNIAAGKSTFLRILAEAGLGFFVVPEPLSKWQGIPADDDVEMPVSASQDAGMNILDKFYSDQERWAFTFQTYAFLSRLRAQLRPFEDYETKPELGAARAGAFKAKGDTEATEEAAGGKRSRDGDSAAAAGEASSKRSRDDKSADAGSASNGNGNGNAAAASSEATSEAEEKILFFERSVLSDKYCFAANCRASGLFEELEWRVYCDWWKFIMQEFRALRIDGLVYLRCSPATCHERLQKRARDEEAGVPLTYLNDLHHRHEEWLVSRTCGREFPITTLVLDTDAEFESDPVRRTAMVDRIRAFVASLASQSGAHIAPSIAPVTSASSSGAAAAASAEASTGSGLGPRLSSRDGTVLMGEIEGLSVMRVGADGKALPPTAAAAAAAGATSDDDEDGVPSGPVKASAQADGDDSGSDGDDGQEAAASSARAPRGKAAGAKGKGGIASFFGKKSA